ncbi:tyrosine recombinase [Rathayibacter sp. AY1C9]|uniref:tyrosine-type recombinase/integrase n=1 Tax=Rathayibacter sp. AY1C9 TaxID=2080541 RepID=UPI000CE896D7|nr:tyrosine-type recombinase/integrase [Rathayibacter sp. AY1C9]PPH47009.1 tyrosine recombinase [Rathayibacter sp. AY1C9]
MLHALALARLLEDWTLWQNAQGLSARTIAERAGVIRALCADLDPLGITPADVMRFCGRRSLAASSRATYHASIRAYCEWLVRTGQRADDPSLSTPRPKRPKGRPRPVSSPQLGALLAVCNRSRTRAYVLLAVLAGLRVHEIAKVHGDDFDLAGGTMTVTGKGGKTALLPLHPQLAEEAAQWPRRGYWFPAYNGAEHVSADGIRQGIGSAMQRAGVPGTPHQLRHWYGTALVAEGVQARIVQELMRHESMATTSLYTDVTLAQLRAGLVTLRLPEAMPLAA